MRNAGEIYSVLFSSFALASLVGAKLTMTLVSKVRTADGVGRSASSVGTALGVIPTYPQPLLVRQVGWAGIFKVLAGMGCVAVGLLRLLHQEKKNPAPWEES